MQAVHQEIADGAAQRGHGAGQRHLDQRHPPVAAAAAQHHQVAHVVRHLMGQHGERGNHAQAQVRHERGGNQDAVTETMHAVTGEHGPAAGFGHVAVCRVGVMAMGSGVNVALRVFMGVVVRRARRGLVVVFMPVMPQLGLVQQEEEHQADQQREKQVVRAGLALERLRQQVQEGGGQQGTGRHAEHVLGESRQNAETQGGCDPHAADAGGQGADPD